MSVRRIFWRENDESRKQQDEEHHGRTGKQKEPCHPANPKDIYEKRVKVAEEVQDAARQDSPEEDGGARQFFAVLFVKCNYQDGNRGKQQKRKIAIKGKPLEDAGKEKL